MGLLRLIVGITVRRKPVYGLYSILLVVKEEVIKRDLRYQGKRTKDYTVIVFY